MPAQTEWEEKLSLTNLLKHQVWVNPTNHQSLRLTKFAFELLSNSPSHKFYCLKLEGDAPIVNKTYVQLERHFTSPYYIYGSKTIYVYHGIEVTMLALNDGNLSAYLNTMTNY